jgi:membrane protease subunit HflC
MESYKASFKDKQDMMVLQPNSAFFRYMNAPKGGK